MFKYNTTTRTVLADLYTPVSMYMRLRDIYPQSVLMESSDYHEKDNSHSFIGLNPIASVSISHGEAIATYPDGATQRHAVGADYRSDKAINDFLDQFSITGEHSEYCGLYGYTSFNAVRYFENIAVKDTTMAKNDAPDMMYIFFRDIIVFDHFNNKMVIVTLTEDGDETASGTAQIDNLMTKMNKANVQPYDFRPIGGTTSPLTDEEHKANIRKGISHCLRGMYSRL